MLQRQHHTLVVEQLVVGFLGLHLLLQQYALRRIFHNNRTDDTCEKNHHHNTIEHVGINDIGAVGHLHTHTHHRHCNTTGCMSLSESEHHVSTEPRIPEHEARGIGSNSLGERGEQHHAEHHPQCVEATEENSDVNQHSHSNQEIRDEKSITDKLKAIHQRRDTRNEAIENKTGKECAKDTLQSAHLRHCRTEKQYTHCIYIQHHRVGIMTEEPSCEPGHHECHQCTKEHHLHCKQHPERDTAPISICPNDGGKDKQRQCECNHRRPHT